MQVRKRWLDAIVLAAVLAAGCAAPRQLENTGDVDPGWAGMWKGKILIVNSKAPPRDAAIEIRFTSTRIRAYLSDSVEKLSEYPVKSLHISADSIAFEASYDSFRGLRTDVRYEGRRLGRHMMLDLRGREGGRAFRGKLQALRVASAPPPPPEPAQPAKPDSSAASGL